MQILLRNAELLPLPRRLRRHRRKIVLALAGFVYSGLLIGVGGLLHREGFFAYRVRAYLSGAWLSWPLNSVKAIWAEPERLVIDMKWEAYQNLSAKRQWALKQGILIAQDDDYVPARIVVDGESTKVRMRLKGDATDHLRGDKWSFRVIVRGDNTIWGMKQFSLHHPGTRNWMFEWLAHRAMRREGVIALRYQFADVTLNGKHLGVYAVEEHFEKRLIENNARRQGPIVRFSEDLFWRETMVQRRPFPDAESNGPGRYLAAELDGFQTTKTLADEELRKQYLSAVHLLGLFRRGDISTSQAFDVEKLATYFALLDLLGGEHGARWHNIRFYYNPVTSRLEPIAFDFAAGRPTQYLSIAGGLSTDDIGISRRYYRTLFDDMDFCRRYLSELERVSQPDYLDELLAETADDFDKAITVIYTEFPYYKFSSDVLRRNRRYIQTALNPHQGVHAYVNEARCEQVTLAIGNLHSLPIVVTGIQIDGDHRIESAQSVILRPRQFDQPVDYREVSFSMPVGADALDPALNKFTVLYHLLGVKRAMKTDATPYAYAPDAFRRNDLLRRAPNIAGFPFVEVDEDSRIIRLAPGEWQVDRDMIAPPGYIVACGPNTRIDLVKSALFLSYSPLQWLGEEEAPIVIRSSDGTGQGLVVLQAGDSSRLEHVHFNGLTNPQRAGWSLSGAVTFYESPVSLSRCRFVSNTCEDALNTIRTNFSMVGCRFVDTMADAFDSDFCKGSISDTTFTRCGNDGIDISGSVIDLESVTINTAGDKAVSVGEASRLVFDNLTVRDAHIGLACKDSSEVAGSGLSLSRCRFGLTAFRKKPEFGPGTVSINDIEADDVNEMYLIEEGSVVTVDGRRIVQTSDDVLAIVYPAQDAPHQPEE